MKSLKVVIVYASRYGHTKLQAEAVAGVLRRCRTAKW